jgi:uncharacterized protein DUF6069
MATKTAQAVHSDIHLDRIWRAGLITALAATAANLLLFLTSLPFEVPGDFSMLQPAYIVGSTLVGVAGATLVFAAIARFARRPVAMFRVVAVVFLLVSLVGPFQALTGTMPGFAAVNAQTFIAMALMHIITGALCIIVLPALVRRK